MRADRGEEKSRGKQSTLRRSIIAFNLSGAAWRLSQINSCSGETFGWDKTSSNCSVRLCTDYYQAKNIPSLYWNNTVTLRKNDGERERERDDLESDLRAWLWKARGTEFTSRVLEEKGKETFRVLSEKKVEQLSLGCYLFNRYTFVPYLWPWTTKSVLSQWSIFVAIAKNILHGPNYKVFFYAKNQDHIPWRYFVNSLP